MALRVTFFIFPSLLHKAFHLFNLLCVTLEIHYFFSRLQLEACCCRCLIRVEAGCKKCFKCTTALCCKGNGDVVFKNQLFGINNRGHCITNPNNALFFFGKSLKFYHRFASSVIPPKVGSHLMIPEQSGVSYHFFAFFFGFPRAMGNLGTLRLG